MKCNICKDDADASQPVIAAHGGHYHLCCFNDNHILENPNLNLPTWQIMFDFWEAKRSLNKKDIYKAKRELNKCSKHDRLAWMMAYAEYKKMEKRYTSKIRQLRKIYNARFKL